MMANMGDLPPTMRSLVAPRKCKPALYEIQSIPTSTITQPTEVIVKVRSASISTGDTIIANHELPMFSKPTFPVPLSMEGSGTVIQIGGGVKHLRVGDEVYGLAVEKPMFRGPPAAFASEYAVIKENLLLHKPPSLSFEDASSVVGSTVTAFQVIKRGLQLMGCSTLEGKTVFVPAGLSATGSIAIQVAKNVFGASRIITTVSTSKVPLVEKRLPGMVDQVIDYKTQQLTDHVRRGSVDFMFNTQFSSLKSGIPLVNPTTGVIMLIAGIPNRSVVEKMLGDSMPWWFGPVLDLAQCYYKWLFWGTKIGYEFLSGSPDIREDLERVGEIVALGKVVPVTTTISFTDLEVIRRECEKTRTGKGGLGRLVIRIDEDRGS